LKSTNPIRTYILIAATVGLIIGVLLGLIYGYIINPVEWVDAPMDLTRADIQEDYLRMAIDSYAVHGNPSQAHYRFNEVGENAIDILDQITLQPGSQGIDAVARYRDLVLRDITITTDTDCITPAGPDYSLFLYLWLLTLILMVILFIYFYRRTRPQGAAVTTSLPQPSKVLERIRRTVRPVQTPAMPEPLPKTDPDNPPFANFMTTYITGGEHFDVSYSIDTDRGAFLGECGIEEIEVGEEDALKGASAFDVWLFDKNEINTKSVVLMSDRVYADDLLRTQLESKGQPSRAIIGRESVIATDHLLMKFRIVDMVCVKGEGGKCDYFTRVSVDINIWQINA
jgi:hypothetical protein